MKRISVWLFAGALFVAIPAGTLVAKERKSLELLFRMADTNSDGKLSSNEFAEMQTADKEEKPGRSFKKLDRNGDGRLTFREFERSKKE
jgi:Ca2+-binding EF-hand superfamily protein